MLSVKPNLENERRMWARMEELFPIYRELVGPGFTESLKRLQRDLPMKILEFATGSKAFDWVIPKEFWVNESYIEHESGQRFLDFKENSLHVYGHSQPFFGEMDLSELLPHITTHDLLEDAIPMRGYPYRAKWGLCASKNQVKALPKGKYKIHIDTELRDGFMRMGELYLPGKTEQEILISTYLCHPHGANDNLSGVVVATELFHMLQQMKERHYSYRLLVITETIGSITYIYNYPERLKKMVGGYSVLCTGDSGQFTYKQSKDPHSLIDRAAVHALKSLGYAHQILPYYHLGSDERQFNSPRLRIPYGCIMRSAPNAFPEYHTSLDDLTVVNAHSLFEALNVYWHAVQAIERARTYVGTHTVEPFLTAHKVYPHDLGVGDGQAPTGAAEAFYQLMGYADGEKDLLEVAELSKIPIYLFDRAVKDFLRVGIIKEVVPISSESVSHRREAEAPSVMPSLFS